MAIFGAPIALEDHAARACLAALEIQREVRRLASEVHSRDGVEYALRVGLNSGAVVTGQIGVDPTSYTAVGAQVGMAQRMESAAPAGGVMVSESTARLVEHTAVLGDPQMVKIKGSDSPVPARVLRAMGPRRWPHLRHESPLIGRDNEIGSVDRLLDRCYRRTWPHRHHLRSSRYRQKPHRSRVGRPRGSSWCEDLLDLLRVSRPGYAVPCHRSTVARCVRCRRARRRRSARQDSGAVAVSRPRRCAPARGSARRRRPRCRL